MKRMALHCFRAIFGLYYLAIGLYWIYLILHNQGGFPSEGEGERALTAALTNARFFEPVVIFSCVVGGVLTLFQRTAPCGILILTPVVVMVFLYHAFLTKAFAHATPSLLWLAVLYWLYRYAFYPLVNHHSQGYI